MKKIKSKEKFLLEYFMSNPCISEEIDYEDEKTRRKHYEILIESLDNEELDAMIENIEEHK